MNSFPDVGSARKRFGSGRSRCATVASLTAAILLSGSVSFADPIRVVGGVFLSGGDDTGLSLALSSNLSFATGATANRADPVVVCDPCTPGSQLNLSANVTISNWGAGFATIDGQTVGSVFYSGLLVFDAGSVTIPDVPPQPEGLDGTVIVPAFTTFTFRGTVSGFADPGLTTPIFTADLVGGGHGPFAAQAGFANVGSGVFLDFADFHFDQAAATPEPGSLLLFGSGVAWFAARARKRIARG